MAMKRDSMIAAQLDPMRELLSVQSMDVSLVPLMMVKSMAHPSVVPK